MDNNTSTTVDASAPQTKGDIHTGTVRGNANLDTSVPATGTAAKESMARREQEVGATEIGDSDGRVPSPGKIKAQLKAAKDSDLPVGASRSSHSHPSDDEPIPSSAATRNREHRASNYAPGYEQAYDAVPQKSYGAAGHSPMELPHERLESASQT